MVIKKTILNWYSNTKFAKQTTKEKHKFLSFSIPPIILLLFNEPSSITHNPDFVQGILPLLYFLIFLIWFNMLAGIQVQGYLSKGNLLFSALKVCGVLSLIDILKNQWDLLIKFITEQPYTIVGILAGMLLIFILINTGIFKFSERFFEEEFTNTKN
ncbi:hypothetical protein UA32_12210 [Photobacterium angustum]|uniref:Uncharacterized protein n=1 Tax=Photobacterium angustum TaxID=661 RepID=A0ABX5GYH8_PHOAN|nr:hypothetical protein [Photobacterium angustum]KJG37718.1 hypothetical protein UA32_12210 [Photobacterium angustum]PSX03949.1 hypothetical protein C0W27_20870 [Photobacterium angustum]